MPRLFTRPDSPEKQESHQDNDDTEHSPAHLFPNGCHNQIGMICRNKVLISESESLTGETSGAVPPDGFCNLVTTEHIGIVPYTCPCHCETGFQALCLMGEA